MSINTNEYANQLLAENEKLKRERDELKEIQELNVKIKRAMYERFTRAEAELARRDTTASGPFAYIDISHLDQFGWGYIFKHPSPAKGCKYPVYTAAPPVALPPKLSISDAVGMRVSLCFIEGYNQCRTDALALGAQPQKPVEIPDFPYASLAIDTAVSLRDGDWLKALEAANVLYELRGVAK